MKINEIIAQPLQDYSADEIAQIIETTKNMSQQTGNKRAMLAVKYLIEGLNEAMNGSALSSIILNDGGSAIAIAVVYQTGYVSRVASLVPGLGTVVMNDLLEKAKRANMTRLYLKPNAESMGFYKKLGFVLKRGFMFLQLDNRQ